MSAESEFSKTRFSCDLGRAESQLCRGGKSMELLQKMTGYDPVKLLDVKKRETEKMAVFFIELKTI